MAICAAYSPLRTLARRRRPVARLKLGAAGGYSKLTTLCAGRLRGSRKPGHLETSRGQHASAYSVCRCSWVAGRGVVLNDVGARKRPNTDANQRGRASVSSSAGNGGTSKRLALASTIEALLYTGDRPRY